MPTTMPSRGPPLALSDLSGLPASFLYLPPSRHLQLPGNIPRSQFRTRHPLPDTPTNMEHKCLPWQARPPRAHPARPVPPGPTAYCEHFPRAKQCAKPFIRIITFRTCNMPGRSECCHSQYADSQQGTHLVRNKNLVHFRKTADPLFRYCKFPAGLISLLSAHLASKQPDEPTKAECGVGTTFTPHQHPLPRWPQKAWYRPSGVSLLPPSAHLEDQANRARVVPNSSKFPHILSKQRSVSVWLPYHENPS